MTLAVVGTLSTNNKSNKQKEAKTNTLNFSMMSYEITSQYGFWVNFIKSENPKNSHINSALNQITYVYMCISSTLAAILVTSSFGPETELRCVNWF